MFLVTRHLPCLLACEPLPPPKCRTTEPPGSRVRHIFDSTLSSTPLYTLSASRLLSLLLLSLATVWATPSLITSTPPHGTPFPLSTLSITFNKTSNYSINTVWHRRRHDTTCAASGRPQRLRPRALQAPVSPLPQLPPSLNPLVPPALQTKSRSRRAMRALAPVLPVLSGALPPMPCAGPA